MNLPENSPWYNDQVRWEMIFDSPKSQVEPILDYDVFDVVVDDGLVVVVVVVVVVVDVVVVDDDGVALW